MIFLTGGSACLAANPTVQGFLPKPKPPETTIAAAVMETAGGAAAKQSAGRTTVTLRPGDTLVSTLRRAGVPAAEAYRDLAKLKGQIDPRRLQPGDKLTLIFAAEGDRRRLASVVWSGKRAGNASVTLLPGAAQQADHATEAAVALKTIAVHGSSALPRELTESGLPPQICEQVMIALSQARQPPVHGEMVKIVYQMPLDPASGPAPQLRYAAYVGRDGKQHVFHYTALAVPASLQQIDLTPAVAFSLLQPLPGARISSPFGWRVHPVFHTRRFHKGVDYEAALGTPVIAAADGIVEDVGRRGSYGNYIRIRHSARLETAYAHLSAFAARLAVGVQIYRGDVIGYVGMTGVATGPHLYYELLVDGRQIDPEGKALREVTQQRLAQTASVP